MRFKKWIMHLTLLVVFISFFYLPVSKPYPEYPVMEGPAQFDGDRAYELLETLVTQFPGRFVGTEAAGNSALWVEEYFLGLGLETNLHNFTAYYNPIMAEEEITSPYLVDMTREAEGINVIGVSAGQSEEIIVIGAHRDVIFTQEGAEDNGSGTVAMMELARILTQDNHYYTYMFVSFDGEETGLYGSYALAEELTGENVRLAISIDMVGIAHSDGVDLYEFITPKAQSPLWTVALAKNLAASSEQRVGVNSPGQYLSRRMFGIVPTDTHPFLIQGVPVLGVLASDPQGIRIIHDPDDVMENISAATLGQSGQFLERYILSVADVPAHNSQTYIPFADVYTPGWFYPLHLALALLVLSGMLLRNIGSYVRDGGKLDRLLRGEIKWLLPGFICSALVGGIAWSINTTFVQERVMLPLVMLAALLALGICIVSLIVTAVLRSKKSYSRDQQALHNLLQLLLLAVGVPLIGPLPALVLTLVPVSVLAFRSQRWRGLAIAVWAVNLIVTFGVFMASSLNSFGNPFTPAFALSASWFIMLCYVSGLYTMAAPAPLAVSETELPAAQ